jgi:hypothetical protein
MTNNDSIEETILLVAGATLSGCMAFIVITIIVIRERNKIINTSIYCTKAGALIAVLLLSFYADRLLAGGSFCSDASSICFLIRPDEVGRLVVVSSIVTLLIFW